MCIIDPMYIETVPNRNSPPAVLLREGWREGKKTVKRTLANLTHWPAQKIEALRRLLRDQTLVSPQELFTTQQTLPHGHVQAVLGTIRKLGLAPILSAKRCRERDLVVAMIAQRLLDPCSKLATTRAWHTTTLAEELGVEKATEDDLYQAMDWLLERKERIEKKLAERHLAEGCLVLYDVTSSYYEGRTCPLARFGHDRDGQKGRPIIVYGVMTDREGCPISVRVYPGNTGDPKTVVDQVEKLRQKFGLSRVVLVGDRGMLTQPQIDKLKQHPGWGWITALKSVAIRRLVQQGALQLSLLDEKNLAEITSPDYPGERLLACYNPLLAEERGRKRRELLEATEKGLAKISQEVARRKKKLLKAAEIALKVGKVLGHYKMGKHFECTIGEGSLQWKRREEAIQQEAKLDGIYVIRTSESQERLSAEATVRSYKSLSEVERAFRCLKGMELRVRPIHHRTEERVPAHIFLCLLAYYVEWHLRRAWAPILFEDEERREERERRDPIGPAKPSQSAQEKKSSHQTRDGIAVHSFETLMADLATRARVTYSLRSGDSSPIFKQVPEPTAPQARAYELLGLLPVAGN
ncbi:MAG TPA: IS1634 family transposase [Candidatus Methylomirabilis sp.]|nr:IS1634 family transposase [Candidatus Methylomirabilis sp.]